MPRIVFLSVLLALSTSICQADAVNGVDYGDFSDSPITPTQIGTLELGDTVVDGVIESIDFPDADIFTFTVASGQRLDAIILNSVDGDNHFFAIDEGSSNDPTTGRDFLLARLISGTERDTNLLGPVPLADNYGPPESIGGISPVGPGDYSIWMRENVQDVYQYNMTLRTSAVAVPEPTSAFLLFAITGGLVCRRRSRRNNHTSVA